MAPTPEPESNLINLVLQRLYENENITGALTDDSAQILLKWGEQKLANLAQFDPDAQTVDNIVAQAERVLRAINRLTDRRADLSETDMVEQLLKLVERAMALGVTEFMIQQGISHDQET